MPKLPGVSYREAVRVFTKLGFVIKHEGKHTIMSNGQIRLSIPRHNPINAFTMAAIAKDAGLTPEQFRELV
jgi:predicted RNA binding protein YcfA (HicA-like mRNA interferase family)